MSVPTALRTRKEIRPPGAQPSFHLRDLIIEYDCGSAYLVDEELQFTTSHYLLLRELSRNSGRVLSDAELVNRVWGLGHEEDQQPARSLVKHLRR